MNIKGLLSFLPLCFFLAVSASAQYDPLSQWAWRNPMPQTDALMGIAYGNGSYVAVGGDGIITSQDATNWIGSISDADAFLYGLRYINNMFVATGLEMVGAGGTGGWTGLGVIMTSANGGYWTNSTTGTDDIINDVTFGNGQWVAVGQGAIQGDGSVVTSTDGIHWTNSLRLTDTPFFAAVFANNLFVIAGYDADPAGPNGVIYVSSDGFHWTNCPSASASGGWAYNSIVVNNGHLVAVGGRVVANSQDGINWSTTFPSSFEAAGSVAYGNNHYVAVGRDGPVMTSPDGTNWNLQNTTGCINQAIGYCSSRFITVGCNSSGLSGTIFTSPDGTNWLNSLALQEPGDSFDLFSVAFGTNKSGSDLFVAVGGSSPGSGVILTSLDGTAWTMQNAGAATGLNGVGEGNNRFVAVGNDGYITTSSDGVNWTYTGITSTNPPSGGPPVIEPYKSGPALNSVAFGAGQFVAVGDTILTSSNGVNWLKPSFVTGNTLLSIAWSGSQFVAVGDSGTIINSTNGIDWVAEESGSTNTLTGVAYGESMFVATVAADGPWTDGNQVLTSSDGINWTGQTTTANLISIGFGANQFISPGGNSGISTSADGINWTNRVPFPLYPFWGVAYGEGTFVAVGENGEILQSQYLANPLLEAPRLVQNNSVQIPIAGKPGWTYLIQASPDLRNWVNLTNVVLKTPSGTFGASSSTQQRFYRILPQ